MSDTAPVTPEPIRLGINVDHVATLRQARGTAYPDVIEAAQQAIAAGADSITVHLREDRRHIQDADVATLTGMAKLPVNLEMAVTDEMLAIAEHLRPRDACFVPEKREELTTEGGLDVTAQPERIAHAVDRLRQAGIQPALFIDPDPAQIEAAATSGAGHIELHTGRFADAPDETTRTGELERLIQAATQAASLGLEVHAGHGLHTGNVQPIAELKPVVELNIGHAIIARAVFVGLPAAVSEMREVMTKARGGDV